MLHELTRAVFRIDGIAKPLLSGQKYLMQASSAGFQMGGEWT